jgi:hypothetical protein
VGAGEGAAVNVRGPGGRDRGAQEAEIFSRWWLTTSRAHDRAPPHAGRQPTHHPLSTRGAAPRGEPRATWLVGTTVTLAATQRAQTVSQPFVTNRRPEPHRPQYFISAPTEEAAALSLDSEADSVWLVYRCAGVGWKGF